MYGSIVRTDGGYGVPGMPGNSGGINPLAFMQGQYGQPMPGYEMAGNPFGSSFVIPNKKPAGQPVLPGENRRMIEGVYGSPQPRPMPGAPALPMAFGSSNLPNAIGNMGGMANAQFYNGPQMGQPPQGFQGKYVS
jgi:hypothetical protein